jgi:hypothetical protein
MLRKNTMYHIVFLRSMPRLLVTVNVVPSSPIIVVLMLKAISSSETSVLPRATRRNFTEDGILHSHRRQNHKSYQLENLHKPRVLRFSCTLKQSYYVKAVARISGPLRHQTNFVHLFE